MSVLNTDLGRQLGASALGARLWRLAPGQASTKHRHREQEELYVLLEGSGRVRIDEEAADPGAARLAAGRARARSASSSTTPTPTSSGSSSAPRRKPANTLEMSEELLRALYPDGPKAMPPELGG